MHFPLLTRQRLAAWDSHLIQLQLPFNEFLKTLESPDLPTAPTSTGIKQQSASTEIESKTEKCLQLQNRHTLPDGILIRMYFPSTATMLFGHSGIAFFHENHQLCSPNHLLSLQKFLLLPDNSKTCCANS